MYALDALYNHLVKSLNKKVPFHFIEFSISSITSSLETNLRSFRLSFTTENR